MNKALLIIILNSVIFAGEIFDEKTINSICKTDGYLKTFETEVKCKDYFLEKNKEALESKKLKDISVDEFIRKNFSKIDEQKIGYYNYISLKFSLNTRIHLHLIDKMFGEFKKESYSKINYFNYSNKVGVFRGPSNADELKDYLTKFNKEHILHKLDFDRIVKFIDNSNLDENIYVYKTFPYRIIQEKHFKYEILAKYFESFKYFKTPTQTMKDFLIEEFSKQNNVLIKLTIYNTLLSWDINIYDINQLIKELRIYIDENLFLNDYVTSYLIEQIIINIKMEKYNKLLQERNNDYKSGI